MPEAGALIIDLFGCGDGPLQALRGLTRDRVALRSLQGALDHIAERHPGRQVIGVDHTDVVMGIDGQRRAVLVVEFGPQDGAETIFKRVCRVLDAFGGEVGDGWRGLTENFSGLDRYLGGEAASPGMRIVQIKEKLGLLRVYLRDVPQEAQPDVQATRDMAIRESRITCEVCGVAGRFVATGGWLRVRCNAHEDTHTDHH